MKPVRSKTPFKKPTTTKVRNGTKDPVKVFCRIRPMQNEDDVSCMKVISPTTVSITPPESATNYRNGSYKEFQHTFKCVFDEGSTQKEVFNHVGFPLVENLIIGKNGLLFTYGVTGSGKTYTMTGEPHNGGMMPRCLDVLFNSIADYQARKYIFKPDKLNGFDVQSEADALLDQQRDIYSQRAKTGSLKKKDSDPNLIRRTPDSDKVDCVDEDNVYAVFVTYVEIYNNAVYDLLEDIPEDSRTKQLQARFVREDGNHNMYVHSVTEVEVKSPEEAFEAFYKGQKKKRMAMTTLNTESSRSHSVFTIRLVQAPLDSQGETAVQNRNAVMISQLSLVDLAGSERTNRTNNRGQRLREAGNINNSLMTLRTCLEILRENQIQGTNKIVPYRESKITHLFKNYFDGEGQVEMIVCVNPRVEDYDETIHVMKFAEMTQEVQVAQPTPRKLEFGFTPGRRKANQIFKAALKKMEEDGAKEAQNIETDVGLVYSLGPPFPNMKLTEAGNAYLIKGLISFLEMRMNKRNELIRDWRQKHNEIRENIIELEKDNVLMTQESKTGHSLLEQERKRNSALESRLKTAETTVLKLQQTLAERDAEVMALKHDIEQKDMYINQQNMERDKLRRKFGDKIAAEKERNAIRAQQLHVKEAEYQLELKEREEKIRKAQKILSTERNQFHVPLSSRAEGTPLQQMPVSSRTEGTTMQTPVSSQLSTPSQPTSAVSSKRGPAVSNPRHRRSRSAGGEVWLEHKPKDMVELGTVMQPVLKKRKSVTNLIAAKDITNPKVSKYCLVNQEQDSGGELETRIYKGDVIPTVGGGSQVIFNDVETLKQKSPTSSPPRKRNVSATEIKDTAAICAVSIEGHKRPRV